MREPPPSQSPEPEFVARRGLSFGGQARAYAEHRPGYPDEALEWALAPVADRDPLRVLDLGAGTGKLTEAAARQDVTLIAVEPDEAMREEFVRRVPEVAVLPGDAEAIPLPGARVHAVLAGQAFHWFDAERALPEIARVLAPGGVFAALWNVEDDAVGWVAGALEVLRDQQPGAVLAGAQRPEGALSRSATFEAPERAEFRHQQRRSVESLLATLRTHSWALLAEPAERESALAAVREYLAARPETAAGEFDVPLVTVVVRMRLRLSR